LAWAASGKTTWETGVILGLSERTVEKHIARAIDILHATNKTQAVALAMQMNLISPPADETAGLWQE
jgi:LuxR family transcriptional regulator